MEVEGVFFDEKIIRQWKKKEFIERCVYTFFLDRDESDRRDILSDIYDRIKSRKQETVSDNTSETLTDVDVDNNREEA